MSTIKKARALVWEQWRISRLELLLRGCFVLTGVMLFSLVANSLDQTAWLVMRGIFVFLFGMAALFSASWTRDFDSRQLGFTYRLGFVRPITTRWLVGLPVLYSLCCSQLFYLGSALAIYCLTGLTIPLVGPAMIVACTVCMLIAGAWSPTRIDGRIAGMVVAVTLTLGWLLLRDYWRADPDPILLSIGKPGYFSLAWYEYLGLAGAGGLSIAWTLYAVDRQRHGEPVLSNFWQSPALIDPYIVESAPAAEAPSASEQAKLAEKLRQSVRGRPVAAQLCYEARRAAPLGLSVGALLPVGLFLFLCLNLQWEYAPRVWLSAVIILPVILQFLAADAVLGLTHKQGLTRLSPFDAIRPLRCDQLMGIKLLVVFGWSVCGALWVAGWAAVHALLSGQWELWSQTFAALGALVGDVWPGWWFVGSLNLLLAFLCSTANLLAGALWAARYPKVVATASVLLVLHCGMFVWDAVHKWPWIWLWKSYGYGLPLAIILASLLAVGFALRRRYLGAGYFMVAAGAWLFFAVSSLWLVATALPPAPIPLLAYLIGSALLVMSLASAAYAPLALAAHRHQ